LTRLPIDRKTAREKRKTTDLKTDDMPLFFLNDNNTGRYLDKNRIMNKTLKAEINSALASGELVNPI
jgi:hypothetical protein